jgi:hypothetical protein
MGFLKSALISASIYGRKKRFSLLGTREASKERHRAHNRVPGESSFQIYFIMAIPAEIQ